jgi:hypothetical protein
MGEASALLASPISVVLKNCEQDYFAHRFTSKKQISISMTMPTKLCPKPS